MGQLKESGSDEVAPPPDVSQLRRCFVTRADITPVPVDTLPFPLKIPCRTLSDRGFSYTYFKLKENDT